MDEAALSTPPGRDVLTSQISSRFSPSFLSLPCLTVLSSLEKGVFYNILVKKGRCVFKALCLKGPFIPDAVVHQLSPAFLTLQEAPGTTHCGFILLYSSLSLQRRWSTACCEAQQVPSLRELFREDLSKGHVIGISRAAPIGYMLTAEQSRSIQCSTHSPSLNPALHYLESATNAGKQ